MTLNYNHIAVANSLNQSIGVSYQPIDGYIIGGVDKSGRTFYVDPSLANNADYSAASDYTTGFFKTFNPFNIITDDHASALDKIGATASTTGIVAGLDLLYQKGASPKQWIDYLAGTFGKAGVNALFDKSSQTGANSLLSAYLLFSKWGSLSPAQKAIGLASTGIQGIDAFSGTNLANTIIPGSQSLVNGAGLTVGAAMQGLGFGVNAYALASNWGQLDTLGKIAYGTNTLAQGAQLAKSLGMIGTGTTGATTGLTADAISSIGSTAPSYGIGAISLNPGASVPYGYSLLPDTAGESVAVPTANASSAALDVGSTLSQAAAVAGIAAGSYTVMKNWGAGGAQGALVSGLGGASIAAGLSVLTATNPYLLAGVVAFSALSGAIHTGKSEDQLKRDAVRGGFEKLGLSKDYKIQLADGTLADIGADGHTGKHSFRYADKVVGPDKDRGPSDNLFSYDIDYTNDLDFFAGMGGIALSRLLNGADSTNVKQLGGQLGNAALGKVGFNQDLTPDNFNIVMNNLKGMYAKAGISNKSDAIALANKMYGDGRINDFDHTQMLQSINMVYDNDFKLANNLNAGRFAGIKTASDATLHPNSPVNPSVVENTLRARSGVANTTNQGLGPNGVQAASEADSITGAEGSQTLQDVLHPTNLLKSTKAYLPAKTAYTNWFNAPINMETGLPAHLTPDQIAQIKNLSNNDSFDASKYTPAQLSSALNNIAKPQVQQPSVTKLPSGPTINPVVTPSAPSSTGGDASKQFITGSAVSAAQNSKSPYTAPNAFDVQGGVMSKEQAIAANKKRYSSAFDVGGGALA